MRRRNAAGAMVVLVTALGAVAMGVTPGSSHASPPQDLSAKPIDPDRLPAGSYRLSLQDRDLRPRAHERGVVSRIVLVFTLNADGVVIDLSSLVTDAVTGVPLQATLYPEAGGMRIFDYGTCKSELVPQPPSSTSARGMLTDTVGILPPYPDGRLLPPSTAVNDGEVAVTVAERAPGGLGRRTVTQRSSGTGEALHELTGMHWEFLGSGKSPESFTRPPCPKPSSG